MILNHNFKFEKLKNMKNIANLVGYKNFRFDIWKYENMKYIANLVSFNLNHNFRLENMKI